MQKCVSGSWAMCVWTVDGRGNTTTDKWQLLQRHWVRQNLVICVTKIRDIVKAMYIVFALWLADLHCSCTIPFWLLMSPQNRLINWYACGCLIIKYAINDKPQHDQTDSRLPLHLVHNGCSWHRNQTKSCIICHVQLELAFILIWINHRLHNSFSGTCKK